MKLATPKEIEITQSAMSALRHAVTNTTQDGAGANARQKLSILKSQFNAAETALDVVRGSAPYHAGIRALLNEFDRLQKTATNLMHDLSQSASYKGPRRGTMSTAEKAKYISQHGSQAFFALPG